MKEIKNIISAFLNNKIKEMGCELTGIFDLLEYPADPSHGDISFPCFRLSKALKKAPQQIAADISGTGDKPSSIEKIENVGGYINFYIDRSFYSSLLNTVIKNGSGLEHGTGKTICIDFSSPNIAKKFHLGHIGTTMIGNSLRNIFNYCGYRVIAINYLGDWGTQFGKLITAFKMWSDYETVDKNGIIELEKIYIRFNQECKNDPSLEDKARAAFRELENGNAEYLKIWKYFKEISLKEYQKTYDLLDISFDSYNGESFFTDKMPAVVNELKEKGLLKIDGGASVVDLSDHDMPPALILKSDGTTLYPTRDIAAAIWRKKEYDFEKCIYVTSAGQSLHFAQWFKVVDIMGYDWSKDLVHVPYGTMSFGGEKLASRTGNIIHLDELLETAIEKAEKIIEEKNNELKNKHETAVAVGTGAVIFNALVNNRIRDTDFSWEIALSFEGNTGPYMQYTYARTASILRKASLNAGEKNYSDYLPCEEECSLIKHMSMFDDKILQAAGEYEPSVITRYALELCSLFNIFYNKCRILNEAGATADFRAELTQAVYNTLGTALDLLGIKRTEEI